MPRHSEIQVEFVTEEQKKDMAFSDYAGDFIRELSKFHQHFTLADANDWIERYQEFYVYKTPDERQNRLWMMRNMGRVL